MAGYSPKSLAAKLGLKSGMRVHLRRPPPRYAATLGDLPEDAKLVATLRAPVDFIQAFVTDPDPDALVAEIAALETKLSPGGMIWISWVKKTSPQFSGVTDVVVRSAALETGLVDVKVCAVDDDWSGLKLVRRTKSAKA